MNSQALGGGSVSQIGVRLRRGSTTAEELVAESIERIKRSTADAFVAVCEQQAASRARALDHEARSGRWRGPLHGIPIGVKDVIDTEGVLTARGSSVFAHHVPTRNAHLVDQLEQAGAIIMGKTATQELAYGGTGDRCDSRPPRNPHDRTLITGGSSGGSAAAVADGLVCAAIGTDTGGSVRIPASLCGVVGMKPTHGAISLDGVFPLAPSMDTVGVLAASISDNRIVLENLLGHPRANHVASAHANRPVRSLRLGMPANYWFDDVDQSIAQAVHDAARVFEDAGVIVRDIDVPQAAEMYAAQRTLSSAEAYEQHRELLEVSGGDLDVRVRARFEDGARVSAEMCQAAVEVRHHSQQVFDTIFATVDCLIAPTTPLRATPLHTTMATVDGTEVNVERQLARLTAISNLVGLPSLSVPLREASPSTLPAGLQLIGPGGSEDLLYRLGELYMD